MLIILLEQMDELPVNQQRTPERQNRVVGVRSGRKDIAKQSKSIIANVYGFFKFLSENPDERANLNFHQPAEITARACGVSKTTVYRCNKTVVSAGSEDEIFETPRKKYKRDKKRTGLDDFDKDVVRKTVLSFYDKGEFPTAEKVKLQLQEKIDFEGSERSVRRLFKSLGFKFKKCNDGRKFLMERNDIAAARARFLRKMHFLRKDDSRPVVYLDETWISQNHTKKYIWQDSMNNGGMKVPTGKGGRLIITHAGSSETGFIPESKLLFKGGKKKENNDYHSEMNGKLFKDWFVSLLSHLEEGSIIVMDNASYHSMLKDKVPTSKWKKSEIINWLHSKQINHHPHMTKPELLSLNEIKNFRKTYELDSIANEMGHEVVRLPPYHCQYNPIELIWAQVKREVASKNSTFKIADVERLAHEALDNVTQQDWAKCVRHAVNLQEADYDKECSRDTAIEPIIVNLAESSDDSSDDTSNEEQ